MTSRGDMPAPEMLDERVVTGVLGYNMKVTRGISRHGASDIVRQREIQGIPAAGRETHQLHRDSMLEQLFDQGNIEFRLPRAYEQGEADGLAPDDREIYLMDVLEINEDVVYRRREIGGDGRHKNLTGRG
jgi:hypothetical protein